MQTKSVLALTVSLVAILGTVGCMPKKSQRTATAKQFPKHSTRLDQIGDSGRKIALLLPVQGIHKEAAQTIRDGFFAAYYQNNKSSTANIKVYDTSDSNKLNDAIDAAEQDGANIIVGPLTKEQVGRISSAGISIPVLALNTNEQSRNNIFQFSLNPEEEAKAAAALAYKQGQKRALVIIPRGTWGERLSKAFREEFEEQGGRIVAVETLNSNQDLDNKIKRILHTTPTGIRTDIDMLFLATTAEWGRQIKPLLNFNYAEKLPVYATASIYRGQPNPAYDQDLNGIYFCDIPWVLDKSSHILETRDNLAKLWPKSFTKSTRFFAFGIDAYYLAQNILNGEHLSIDTRNGMTGTLELNSHNQISRQLMCARFQQGVPVVVQN